jgi:DNA-3-methyladenine glycosylase II
MKLTPTHIKQARRHLRAADPVMAAMIDAVGPYTLRFDRDRFGLLVRSIISQQISTSAARAIRKRLMELAGANGLTAENLARFTVSELRSVGLSPQKASYVADLACKVNDGTVDLRRIGRLSDERVVEQLTLVKGIGRWTAQMFLIFSLGRPDVFPHDDLGVRTAIRDRYGRDDLPDKGTSRAIAAP